MNKLLTALAPYSAPFSGIAAITAWQDHVDWAVRVGAGIVAIVAGLCTIHYYRKKGRELDNA